MGTETQRKLNDKAVDEAIDYCVLGNNDAKNYLLKIGFVSRFMDDFTDKDYPVTYEQMSKAFFELLGGLWLNPFFIKNAQTLIPIHIAAFNAFMDANEAEKGNYVEKLYAHVMKDFINTLFGVVAYIVSGFDYKHMRAVSEMVTKLFIEEV